MVQRLRRPLTLLALACLGGATTIVACTSSKSSGAPDPGPLEAGPGPDPLLGCTRDPGAPVPAFDPASPDDPIGGADKFTMALALAGFPAGTGKLTAAISTEKSSITCELLEGAAPISVANFVGLARGTRPYKLTDKWQVGHFYDGLTWHRVIPDFVIQGGDPRGNGTGGPGYDLVKENQLAEPLGTLAMAASSVPSGSQFYIVVGTGPAADYNVFGTCTTSVAIAIAAVDRDNSDKPRTPLHSIKVEIARCP